MQAEYLSRQQAAQLINMSMGWLRKQERLGVGPERIRAGKCIRYTREALNEFMRDNALHIPFGKTANARRSIPLPNRVTAILNMRKSVADSEWVFPAPTRSRHIEQSTLAKRHRSACDLAGVGRLPFYTFRHTCLTRWSSHMDPYTLAYFAGHSDFGTTRRYVHPNMDTGRAAMERARVPAPVVTEPGTSAPSPTPSKPS